MTYGLSIFTVLITCYKDVAIQRWNALLVSFLHLSKAPQVSQNNDKSRLHRDISRATRQHWVKSGTPSPTECRSGSATRPLNTGFRYIFVHNGNSDCRIYLSKLRDKYLSKLQQHKTAATECRSGRITTPTTSGDCLKSFGGQDGRFTRWFFEIATTALEIFQAKWVSHSVFKNIAAVLPKAPVDSPSCHFSGVLDHFLRGLNSRDFTQVTVQFKYILRWAMAMIEYFKGLLVFWNVAWDLCKSTFEVSLESIMHE